MLKRIILNCLILSFMFVILLSNISYATWVPVTDENLKEIFDRFSELEEDEDGYEFSVSNDVINVSVNNETYTLNYDLTEEPTFTFELPIEKGISYEEYEKQTEKLNLPKFGYIAVANIQGAAIEDAAVYWLFSYLEAATKEFGDKAYLILEDGVTVETENTNVIYKSEFGEKVIEFVDKIYSDKPTISDNEDLDSYTMTIEMKDVTETSCKLVSTLKVNPNADFSELDGIADDFFNNNITKENADYVVSLKVGQKCKIESNEVITGYELHNSDCIEMSEDKTEITAIKEGYTNGYLHIGGDKKSIYIDVIKNENNEPLDLIILKIDEENSGSLEDKKEIQKEENKIESEDETISENELPKAGLNKTILLTIIIFAIFIITVKIKLKKYNDIY